jgi:hypothetical protein
MAFEAHRNMPKLVGASVAPPPRAVQGVRRPDPDDLPILAEQTPDQRDAAIRLGSHVTLESPPPIDELIGRPYQLVQGRALSVRADLLTARKLILAPQE